MVFDGNKWAHLFSESRDGICRGMSGTQFVPQLLLVESETPVTAPMCVEMFVTCSSLNRRVVRMDCKVTKKTGHDNFGSIMIWDLTVVAVFEWDYLIPQLGDRCFLGTQQLLNFNLLSVGGALDQNQLLTQGMELLVVKNPHLEIKTVAVRSLPLNKQYVWDKQYVHK